MDETKITVNGYVSVTSLATAHKYLVEVVYSNSPQSWPRSLSGIISNCLDIITVSSKDRFANPGEAIVYLNSQGFNLGKNKRNMLAVLQAQKANYTEKEEEENTEGEEETQKPAPITQDAVDQFLKE